MRLDWDGSYIADPCTDLDFDLELHSSTTMYIDDSYGSCPEEIIIAGTDADDTYTLDVSLWENAYGGALTSAIPVSVTFTKAGVYSETYDLSGSYALDNPADGTGAGVTYVPFTVLKVGNVYTVTDAGAVQVVSGKVANNRMSAEQKIALKNRK